jgi:hypothetical protein
MDIDELFNSTYLMALMDTYAFIGKYDVWPKDKTVGEVAEAVNKFYEDPANWQIPVTYAVDIVKIRTAGNTDKAINLVTWVA